MLIGASSKDKPLIALTDEHRKTLRPMNTASAARMRLAIQRAHGLPLGVAVGIVRQYFDEVGRKENERQHDKRAATMHIELRNPMIGVSMGANGMVSLKIGSDPLTIGQHIFNGVALDVDTDWIDGAIAQLNRAKELRNVC